MYNTKEGWLHGFRINMEVMARCVTGGSELTEKVRALVDGKEIELRQWIIDFCEILALWHPMSENMGGTSTNGSLYAMQCLQYLIRDAQADGFRVVLDEGENMLFFDPEESQVGEVSKCITA